MRPARHHIAPILKELALHTFDGIADMVCVGNRPSAQHERDTFIVIRTGSRIGEHGPWQQMALYVEIYVRNLQNGLPNIARLQELEEQVMEKFPFVMKDRRTPDVWRWEMTNPLLTISGDDQLGFSAWLVRASLKVNTTDRFAATQQQQEYTQ